MFHRVEAWDWSGAGSVWQRRVGLARASWLSMTHQYALAHGFSRQQVIQHLCAYSDEAEQGEKSLVAMDFPFSFPWIEKGGVFPDGSGHWIDFTANVHQVLDAANGRAAAFYGGPAAYGAGGSPDHFAHLYLGAQHIGPHYLQAYRATETTARAIQCPAASVFRMINPMVGVQSLAGIHVLRSVMNWCQQNHRPLTIWPLGQLDRHGAWHPAPAHWNWDDSGPVLIECFPRVSFARAGVHDRVGFGAVPTHIAAAAAVLGVPPKAIANHIAPQGTDERDALIALLHLLSPDWFCTQVCPGLAPFMHLHDVAGPVVPVGAVPPAAAAHFAQEGNIYGV